MIKYGMAAALALTAVQPAMAADVLDYNVYASNAAYISGGSYGDIASGSFGNANGANGTNYTSRTSSTAAFNRAADSLSDQLLAMMPTGTASWGQWTPGAVTLTGTGSGVNVFNLNGSSAPLWSNLYSLTFAGSGTGAIVNVWGSSMSNYINMNFGGLAANNVIFNFHQASYVGMDGMNIRGSILAPDAVVALAGGSVSGTVVSDSFWSRGTTVGGTRFTGAGSQQVQAVPEPGTWALMILGFGAIGLLMRRRKVSENPRIRFA